jgi:hypothetical protein
LLLKHRPHRAIEDYDALAEKFTEGQALLDQVSHVRETPRRMPLKEPEAVGSNQSKALRTPAKQEEISVFTHIVKAFHSLLRLKIRSVEASPSSLNALIMAYAASERNSTLKEDGTSPAAAPRESNSRTAWRPSSP